MINYTKQEAIDMLTRSGKAIPEWMATAPDDATFAAGFNGGHVPFHRPGTEPKPIHGSISIDPTYGMEDNA